MSVIGVDLSSNNGEHIDFKQLYKDGVRFAPIKVTQGAKYVNQFAEEHAAKAKEAGIIPGGYHFVDPSKDHTGRDEGDHFIYNAHKVKLLDHGCLRPAIDSEKTSLMPGTPTRKFHYAVIERVIHRLGTGTFHAFDGHPFEYSASWFWDGVMKARNPHDCPFWIAAYTQDWKRYVPVSFHGLVVIHQETDKKSFAHVNGHYDLDRYLGKNVDALKHRHTLLKTVKL